MRSCLMKCVAPGQPFSAQGVIFHFASSMQSRPNRARVLLLAKDHMLHGTTQVS